MAAPMNYAHLIPHLNVIGFRLADAPERMMNLHGALVNVPHLTPAETFCIHPSKHLPGGFHLQNPANGKFLVCEDDHGRCIVANRQAGVTWESFIFETVGLGNRFRVRTFFNTYLNVEGDHVFGRANADNATIFALDFTAHDAVRVPDRVIQAMVNEVVGPVMQKLESERDAVQQQLVAVQGQLEAANVSLNTARHEAATHGDASQAKSIQIVELNAKLSSRIDEVNRLHEQVQQLQHSNNERALTVGQLEGKLAGLNHMLEAARAETAQLRNELTAKTAQIAAAASGEQAVVAALQQQLADKEAERASVQAKCNEFQALSVAKTEELAQAEAKRQAVEKQLHDLLEAQKAKASRYFVQAAIVNVLSKRALQVADGGAAGSKVMLWDLSGQPVQRWNISSKGNLRNLASGMLLVQGDYSKLSVEPAAAQPKAGEQWFFTRDQNVQSASNDKVLDCAGDGTAAGTEVCVYKKHGPANQLWRIVTDFALEAPAEIKEEVIADDVSLAAEVSGRVLDTAEDGSLIVADFEAARGTQKWDLLSTGFIVQQASQLCLEAVNNGAQGARIVLAKKSSFPNQQWRLTAEGLIRNVATGRVLDVQDIGKQKATVLLWDAHGGVNQRFRVINKN